MEYAAGVTNQRYDLSLRVHMGERVERGSVRTELEASLVKS